MQIQWIDGFEITVKCVNDTATISANREGLLSLSQQLAILADGIAGDHIHYDEYNSLEKDSSELIVVKI